MQVSESNFKKLKSDTIKQYKAEYRKGMKELQEQFNSEIQKKDDELKAIKQELERLKNSVILQNGKLPKIDGSELYNLPIDEYKEYIIIIADELKSFVENEIKIRIHEHKNTINPHINSAMSGINTDIKELKGLKEPLLKKEDLQLGEFAHKNKVLADNDIQGAVRVENGGTGCNRLEGMLKGDGINYVKTAEPYIDYIPGQNLKHTGFIMNVQNGGVRIIELKELKEMLNSIS